MKTQKYIILLALVALVATGCASSINENQNTGASASNNSALTVDDGIQKNDYFIRLTSPQKGQVLESPFLVGGETNIPGQVIYVRVKNPNGDVVIREQASVKEDEDGKSAFGVLIRFVFSATDKGTVEVYAKDSSGKEVALKTVEVNFDTSSSGSVENPAQ